MTENSNENFTSIFFKALAFFLVSPLGVVIFSIFLIQNFQMKALTYYLVNSLVGLASLVTFRYLFEKPNRIKKISFWTVGLAPIWMALTAIIYPGEKKDHWVITGVTLFVVFGYCLFSVWSKKAKQHK